MSTGKYHLVTEPANAQGHDTIHGIRPTDTMPRTIRNGGHIPFHIIGNHTYGSVGPMHRRIHHDRTN